jgi:hypothetical protein
LAVTPKKIGKFMKKLENENSQNSNYPKILNLTMICEMKGPHPHRAFFACAICRETDFNTDIQMVNLRKLGWKQFGTLMLRKSWKRRRRLQVKVDPFLENGWEPIELVRSAAYRCLSTMGALLPPVSEVTINDPTPQV